MTTTITLSSSTYNYTDTADSNFINGNSKANLIEGGAGNDTIKGKIHNDTLSGGAGDDVLSGGSHKDVLRGGAGNDTLLGGDDGDWLSGGDGDDVLGKGVTGALGPAEKFEDGPGADTIRGTESNSDTVYYRNSSEGVTVYLDIRRSTGG